MRKREDGVEMLGVLEGHRTSIWTRSCRGAGGVAREPESGRDPESFREARIRLEGLGGRFSFLPPNPHPAALAPRLAERHSSGALLPFRSARLPKSANARWPPQGRASWRLHVVAHSASGRLRQPSTRERAAEAHMQRACVWPLPVVKPPPTSAAKRSRPLPRAHAAWQLATV